MPSPRAGRLWLLLFVSSTVGGGLAAAPHVANERRRVRGVRVAVPTARSAVAAETTATWKERKESEKAAATRLATAMESDEEMPASSLSMPVDKSTPMAQPAVRPAIVPSEAGGAAPSSG